MDVFRTDRIRNVVLLGHGGAGKTTLAEAMAYLAGMTSRLGRVEDGNTVSDYDKEEIKRHFSITTSLIPVPWDKMKVNVLDTLIEEEERVYIEQMLEKCFRCLTGRQKEAIWLRFIQEVDYEEIGIQLDMTPHAVRKLISRAILRIRRQQFPFSPLALYFMLISEKK